MDVILLQPDDAKFIEKLAEKVAEKLRPSLIRVDGSPKSEKIYLTRKNTAEKLGVSAPTVDQFVSDGILPKLGSGKRARFRSEDVDNLYENIGKYYRRSRKNVSA